MTNARATARRWGFFLSVALVGADLSSCASKGDGGATGSGGARASGGSGGEGEAKGTGGAAPGSGGAAPGSGGAGPGSGGAPAGGTGGPGGGGAGGGAALPPPLCPTSWTGSPGRPQLTDASAACFTAAHYLAQAGMVGALVTDNWDPTAAPGDASAFTATYTVAADGSGTHTTVQAAVAAAKASGSTARVYIRVMPGTYRELVCVDGSVPITLYSSESDAAKTTVVFGNYNGKTVDSTMTNPCSVPSKTTYGTSDSTTVFVKAPRFEALNLTFANDLDESTAANTSAVQAVALTTQGDQNVFRNVRLLGNQDTLQVKTSSVSVVARAYFKDCTIEGDTDFVFGRGTAVFDGCTLKYVAGRKTNSTHLAASTEAANTFGFLIVASKITGDASLSGTTYLGRAWDDSSGTAPNGQVLIRETEIGAHIVVASPWTTSTASRAFDADGNRLYEYRNTGPGAAP